MAAELFPEADSRARKTRATILNALANTGLVIVADACGVDASTVSRWKEKDFDRFSVALTAMGLKVVKSVAQCYSAEYIQHLRYFAKRGFDVEEFAEEDPE
jgi:CII protein